MGVSATIGVAVAVEVGLINVGVGVYVLVGGRMVGVDVSAGVEVYATSAAVAVSVGWSATTLGGINIPVNKRPITLIPMKRLIDGYVASARLIRMLLSATIIFRKGFPVEGFVSAGNGGSAETGFPNHSWNFFCKSPAN